MQLAAPLVPGLRIQAAIGQAAGLLPSVSTGAQGPPPIGIARRHHLAAALMQKDIRIRPYSPPSVPPVNGASHVDGTLLR